MTKKIYQDPASVDVLEDQSVSAINSGDLLKRAQALSFQLSEAYKVRRLLFVLWDERSTPAWKTAGADAGGMLQRALVRDFLLLTFHLIDDAKSASSITNCHGKCFVPHLRSGLFKKYYMPLYQDLKAAGKKIAPLRHFIIAHKDHTWLVGMLWKNLSTEKNHVTENPLTFSDLDHLLVLYSYYVNLCNQIVGIGARDFEKEHLSIDGAREIKDALIAAAGS